MQGADRRGRHAMLPRARFRDDAPLAHAEREQDLSQAVVDLVRAGVVQVLALEVHLRASQFPRDAPGQEQGAGTADVVGQQLAVGLPEILVSQRRPEAAFQLVQRGNERFGHIATAVGAELAEAVGNGRMDGGGWHGSLVPWQ
ncbi:hypothetical protein D9M69_628650 [compost metagenome]